MECKNAFFFFSRQEPKTEKDEEHCRKVNEYLNNPPMPGALGGSGSGGHELSALGGIDLFHESFSVCSLVLRASSDTLGGLFI